MHRVLPTLACLVLVGLAGCTGDGGAEDPPAAAPRAVSTPLADLDTTDLAVARADFCEAIADEAVEDALGASVDSFDHYGNGEPAPLVGATEDVAHEYGCVFAAADGTQARAWVFVPPVTRKRADELVAGLARTKGCRSVPGAAAFGSPTLARVCEGSGAAKPAEASYRGLFGDAWLSCSISSGQSSSQAEAEALLERADGWCANVVTAAAAG